MDNPVLKVSSLTKSFGALAACDAVSLSLMPGEIHALIGPNGAGKSTLIQLIAGALMPDAGQVHFMGRDVTPLDTAARARMGLGRSFQITSLLMDATVLENVVLGAIGAQQAGYRFFRPVMGDHVLVDAAEEALDQVGLLPLARHRTSDLSHGQRRQLEMAVALSLSPKAFLLDEPMAGLGLEGSRELTAFLGDLRQRAPILLIEHDMEAVFALADRISVLVSGRIIASGPPAAIRDDAEVRRAYLGDEVLP